MSLVVAGVTDSFCWMVSDAAITGPSIELRAREYLPKVEPSNSGNALVAFAGDEHYGISLVRKAIDEQESDRAIDILVNGSRGEEVEFGYAYFDADGPRLLHISDGTVQSVPALFLGLKDAFETFQRIRHGDVSSYAPLALKTFMCGAKEAVPEPLSSAITTMIDVFVSRPEHDVGGWAVPYLLTADGPQFVTYCYSVSDPLFDQLAPGSLIPHGTQEAGGSSLSVTEFGTGEGVVVYWLQLPGGTVWIKNANGYAPHIFQGCPSEFKAAAEAALGKAISLWVGDQPLGPVRRLRMMRDVAGTLICTMADHGDGLSFAVHNLATPFHSSAEFTVDSNSSEDPIRVDVADDKTSVRLKCLTQDGTTIDMNLTAVELDSLLLELGQARAQLQQQIPLELVQGTTVAVHLNPCWRTNVNIHPGLPDILLNIRHPGYGWLGFVMPHNEARNLGSWLMQHTPVEG